LRPWEHIPRKISCWCRMPCRRWPQRQIDLFLELYGFFHVTSFVRLRHALVNKSSRNDAELFFLVSRAVRFDVPMSCRETERSKTWKMRPRSMILVRKMETLKTMPTLWILVLVSLRTLVWGRRKPSWVWWRSARQRQSVEGVAFKTRPRIR